jgi:hypothetical protein
MIVYPRLYVVFYRPLFGNYQHWALSVEYEEQKMIFEIVGEHPHFECNYLEVDPKSAKSYVGRQFVAVIRIADIEIIRKVAAEIALDNETTEWDCQDYVLEVLDQLESEYVLEEDDEEYIDARSILKGKRGAML